MAGHATIERLNHVARIRTPVCVLGVRENNERIVAIDYLPLSASGVSPKTPLAGEAARQLAAYVADANFELDLPFYANGTAFETRVWDAIRAIPRGQVRTYSDIGRQVHSVPRAIGSACGRNPLPLIIPCHRVVAAGGGIGGFMGGRDDDPVAIKRWLLRHEGALR